MQDEQLARRLDRDARRADKAGARVARAHERALGRHLRRVGRARRQLPLRAVTAGGSAVLAAAHLGPHGLWFVAGAATVASARSLTVLRAPAPLPPAAALAPVRVPPPPGVDSAAFPAVRRLEAARRAALTLLPLVAPAGREAAEQARGVAAEADLALRWQAARLAAVEPHRGAEPDLLHRLERGVSAQEDLVAALADLVSASADPLATGRMRDATDALHGLAAGLREVR